MADMKYPIIRGRLTLEDIAAEQRWTGAPGARLRIQSAGDAAETSVYAITKDGIAHEILFVNNIEISIVAGQPNVARLTFVDVELDVTAEPAGLSPPASPVVRVGDTVSIGGAPGQITTTDGT